MPPTTPPQAMVSLEEYVTAVLDATQRATRASLEVLACPPSGHGSDHDTIPAPYGVEAS